MDSTVIQEIANQLGMAVDQAGQFITEQLPAFAALKVWQNAFPLIIFGVIFVVAIVFSAVCYFVYKDHYKEALDEYDRKLERIANDDKHHEMFKSKDPFSMSYDIEHFLLHEHTPFKSDIPAYNMMMIGLILAVAFLIGALVCSTFIVPNIIGWSQYPEAMLIDMALKAVG